MLVRLISRKSLGTFVPFAFVVLAEGANETMDYLNYGMRWADTLLDIGNTLFWPLMVSVGVRLRPMTRQHTPNPDSAVPAQSRIEVMS
ncbi:MAG: hypothetical protein EOO77_23320 [Oxalobacteraceae bacterium]|nr:MAG: hypothetical protein EOO77_23320 [Oxalobacteraceae bacterium]